MYNFSVDNNVIGVNDVMNIHEYLIKNPDIKKWLDYLKKKIRLLINVFDTLNYAKCMTLGKEQCLTKPTLVNLHRYEYSQGFHFYPLAVNLVRFARSCNTLHNLSKRYVCQIKNSIQVCKFVTSI